MNLLLIYTQCDGRQTEQRLQDSIAVAFVFYIFSICLAK